MRAFALAVAFCAFVNAPAWAQQSSRIERAFFGGESAQSHDIGHLTFWADLILRERAEATAFSNLAAPGATWALNPRALLAGVNAAINSAAYVDDQDNWGVADRWQTSRELAERGGDCEDYAAAKYFALRAAGAPAEALLIAVVTDEATGQRHAVLMVRLPEGAVVLDNLHDDVRSASSFAHYRPLMAMNETGWRLAAPHLRHAPETAQAAIAR